jgi:hypothetical protein
MFTRALTLLIASAILLSQTGCSRLIDVLFINNTDSKIDFYRSGHPVLLEPSEICLVEMAMVDSPTKRVQFVTPADKQKYVITYAGSAAYSRMLGDVFVVEFPVLDVNDEAGAQMRGQSVEVITKP